MMTLAELTQFAREHGDRLTAIETENEQCQRERDDTKVALKSLGDKMDRAVWGIAGILATALVHLVLASLPFFLKGKP